MTLNTYNIHLTSLPFSCFLAYEIPCPVVLVCDRFSSIIYHYQDDVKLKSKASWIWISSLPMSSCRTLGKLINFLNPSFPFYKMMLILVLPCTSPLYGLYAICRQRAQCVAHSKHSRKVFTKKTVLSVFYYILCTLKFAVNSQLLSQPWKSIF